jgi:hypothetical protein
MRDAFDDLDATALAALVRAKDVSPLELARPWSHLRPPVLGRA